MSKINALILSVVVVASAAYGAPAAMAETGEFTKVGSQVKETGGETLFKSAETSVACTGSKGSGGVASSTQLKLEVAYEGCTASVGKASFKAKLTACHLGYEVEDSVKVENGCVISVSECSLTPSSKQLKVALYSGVEDEEGKEAENETNIYMGLEDVVYKASGAPCEKLGIQGSNEGEVIELAEMQVDGVSTNQSRHIVVEGATQSEAIETELEGTSNQVFKFTEFDSITCTSMAWKGLTRDEQARLRLLKTLTATCKSNIFGKVESPAVMTFEKCDLGIYAASGPAIAEEQPAVMGVQSSSSSAGCVFKAVIKGTATCEITFAGLAVWGEVGLFNTRVGSKGVVRVTSPFVEEMLDVPYTTNQNCLGAGLGAGVVGYASFSGTTILRAWKTGATREEKEVKVV